MNCKKDVDKIKKEFLNEIVSLNIEPIIINGHKDCDEAVGIWMTPDGLFVRYSLGEVRRLKEELQAECE